MNVPSWLGRAAQRCPARAALDTPQDGVLSYGDLAARARGLAVGLRRGERVALDLPAGAPFAAALFACFEAGAVAVPLDPRLAPPERARVLERVARVLGEETRAVQARAGENARLASHELSTTAVELYTSGTSGESKLVSISYGNLLWSALGSATAIGLDPRERWLSSLPVSHVGGLSVLVRSAIYGTTAMLHPRWSTEQVLGALRHGGATVVSLVPTTLGRLLDAGLRQPPALRCALIGAAAAPPALLERARAAGIPVSHTYGLTEACSQVTTQAPGSSAGADCGPPLFCTNVELADDGEILARGPTVTGAPGRTLQTGDLGRIDERGRLHVIGRKADTILSGGENVAPGEIEAVLLEHPGVREAGVYGIADSEWGEAVCARIVGDVAAEELRQHCAMRLAAFKVPKHFSFAAELPRTVSGKLLRRELRS